MQTKPEKTNWDFGPVHDLLSSLSSQAAGLSNSPPSAHDSPLSQKSSKSNTRNGFDRSSNDYGGLTLGDFGKIWEGLGLQHDGPVPSVAPFEASTASQKQDNETYASDGAINYPPSSRRVQWRDEVEDGGDLAETQLESPPSHENLTKNQRKKRNKKARKDAELVEMVQNLRRKKGKDGGSSDDIEGVSQAVRSPKQKKKDRKKNASVDETPKANGNVIRGIKDTSAKEVISTPKQKKVSTTPNGNGFAQTNVYQSDTGPNARNAGPQVNAEHSGPGHGSANSPVKRTNSDMPVNGTRPLPHHAFSTPQKQTPLNWPTANPAVELSKNLFNSAPRPNMGQILQNQATQPLPHYPTPAQLTPTRTKPRHEIQPLNVSISSTDRNWSLLLKLLNHFAEDKKHLLSPLQLSINAPQPNGVHVFVDASNILIGFHQHLKRARGIPEGARIPRVYPSFHALALLLERRRPVAKRILLGSNPPVAAYKEAEQVGYEVNLLDKVFKARELTDRQKRFALRDQARANGSSAEGWASESGEGSGGNAASLPAQPPKWVEQGVDEILHLKMSESIMDVDAPENGEIDVKARPTMILATGDAAQAEYSGGFLSMVERALRKGWNVEVAAWGANISMEYWHLERKRVWRGRFRVVKLDDFAEELFPPADGE